MVGASDGSASRAWSRVMVVLTVLSILGWAVPAAMMFNRGFSIQDEGSYLLSYRWWNSNPYFVSGSQYFYGPLFHALHENIALLRAVRLVMVLGSNWWFAWALLGWLVRRRDIALTRGSRVPIALLLIAAGGMAYLWSPLTPGYYDLEAHASLALAALMLSALARSTRPPDWMPLVAGVVSFLLVLTKWPALSVVLLTQGVVVTILCRGSVRQALRYAGVLVIGAAAAAAFCQAFLIRLGRMLPALHKVSSLTAGGSHGLGFLAGTYLRTTTLYVVAAVIFALPLVATYVIAIRSARLRNEHAARFWILGGAMATLLVIPFVSGWRGGSDRGRVMVGLAMAALLAAAIAAALPWGRRAWKVHGTHDLMVAIALLLVPVGQAAGTNVPLLYVMLECLAMWVAVVLIVASHPSHRSTASFAVAVYLAVMVIAIALISGTTTLMDPFKTTGFASDVASVAEIGGLRVSPEKALQDSVLQTALEPYVVRGTTPIFTLDELSGLTYLLGGVPLGSTWTEFGSPTRTAGILAYACQNGDVDRDLTPVLLVNRGPDPDLVRAMRSCGFAYPADFRRLVVAGGPPDVRVYVPAEAKG